MKVGHYLAILCVLILKTQYVAAVPGNSLKLVHIIFRHGERTPTETYKNDPYKSWPEGWGQLTKRGKKQMYNLGLIFREAYDGFLSEYYCPDDVHVISSYAERNLMSAELVLAGLYPPVKEQIWNANLLWQPIPVKDLPRNLDNIIALKKPCPVYDAMLKSAYASERIQNLNSENENLYQYLSKNTGDKINSIGAVERLYNTLEIENEHNLPLPEWTKNLTLQTLRTLAAENLAIFTDTIPMKRFKGGPLLKEITSRMSQKSQSKLNPDLDLVLYSAHDLTIVTLMRTLGFERLLKPDYGASLIFELHTVDAKHEVQLIYMSNSTKHTEHLEMKFCPTPCLLNDFISGLQSVLPVDWEQECIVDEKEK